MAAALHGVAVDLRLDVDALDGVGLEPRGVDLCEGVPRRDGCRRERLVWVQRVGQSDSQDSGADKDGKEAPEGTASQVGNSRTTLTDIKVANAAR